MARDRLEHCFELCSQPAWRLAMSWIGDAHEAFDVVQQAFVVAATKPASIPADNPWPWFRRVVINEARNARRKKRPTPTEKENEMLDPGPDPARAVLTAETSAELRSALDALPEREREAIVLTQLNGLTHAEAAETLGIPVKTLSSHVARGLERLRGKLGSRGEAMLTSMAAAPIAIPPGGWEAATAAWKAAAAAAMTKTTAVGIAAGAVLMKKTLAITGMVVALGVGLGGGAILTHSLTDSPSKAEVSSTPTKLDETGGQHNPLELPPSQEDTDALATKLAAAEAAEKTLREERDRFKRELDDARGLQEELAVKVQRLEGEIAPIRKEQAERGPTFTFGKHGMIEGVTGSNWKDLAAASQNVTTALRQIREKQLAGETVPDEVYISLQKNTEIMRTYEYKTIGVLPTSARHNGEFTHPISHTNLIASELKLAGMPLAEEQVAEIERLGLQWEADYEAAQGRYNATTPRVEKMVDEYNLKGVFVDAVWAVLTEQQRARFVEPKWLHVAFTDLYCPTLMIIHTSPIIQGPDLATVRANLQAMLVQQYAIPEAQLEALGPLLDTWQSDVATILAPVKRAELRMYTFEQGAIAGAATVKLVKAIRDYGMLTEENRARLLDAYAIYIPRVVAAE
jgi:RNA polymerase sigma-70 factor (ECF subfamily)